MNGPCVKLPLAAVAIATAPRGDGEIGLGLLEDGRLWVWMAPAEAAEDNLTSMFEVERGKLTDLRLEDRYGFGTEEQPGEVPWPDEVLALSVIPLGVGDVYEVRIRSRRWRRWDRGVPGAEQAEHWGVLACEQGPDAAARWWIIPGAVDGVGRWVPVRKPAPEDAAEQKRPPAAAVGPHRARIDVAGVAWSARARRQGWMDRWRGEERLLPRYLHAAPIALAPGRSPTGRPCWVVAFGNGEVWRYGLEDEGDDRLVAPADARTWVVEAEAARTTSREGDRDALRALMVSLLDGLQGGWGDASEALVWLDQHTWHRQSADVADAAARWCARPLRSSGDVEAVLPVLTRVSRNGARRFWWALTRLLHPDRALWRRVRDLAFAPPWQAVAPDALSPAAWKAARGIDARTYRFLPVGDRRLAAPARVTLDPEHADALWVAEVSPEGSALTIDSLDLRTMTTSAVARESLGSGTAFRLRFASALGDGWAAFGVDPGTVVFCGPRASVCHYSRPDGPRAMGAYKLDGDNQRFRVVLVWRQAWMSAVEVVEVDHRLEPIVRRISLLPIPIARVTSVAAWREASRWRIAVGGDIQALVQLVDVEMEVGARPVLAKTIATDAGVLSLAVREGPEPRLLVGTWSGQVLCFDARCVLQWNYRMKGAISSLSTDLPTSWYGDGGRDGVLIASASGDTVLVRLGDGRREGRTQVMDGIVQALSVPAVGRHSSSWFVCVREDGQLFAYQQNPQMGRPPPLPGEAELGPTVPLVLAERARAWRRVEVWKRASGPDRLPLPCDANGASPADREARRVLAAESARGLWGSEEAGELTTWLWGDPRPSAREVLQVVTQCAPGERATVLQAVARLLEIERPDSPLPHGDDGAEAWRALVAEALRVPLDGDSWLTHRPWIVEAPLWLLAEPWVLSGVASTWWGNPNARRSMDELIARLHELPPAASRWLSIAGMPVEQAKWLRSARALLDEAAEVVFPDAQATSPRARSIEALAALLGNPSWKRLLRAVEASRADLDASGAPWPAVARLLGRALPPGPPGDTAPISEQVHWLRRAAATALVDLLDIPSEAERLRAVPLAERIQRAVRGVVIDRLTALSRVLRPRPTVLVARELHGAIEATLELVPEGFVDARGVRITIHQGPVEFAEVVRDHWSPNDPPVRVTLTAFAHQGGVADLELRYQAAGQPLATQGWTLSLPLAPTSQRRAGLFEQLPLALERVVHDVLGAPAGVVVIGCPAALGVEALAARLAAHAEVRCVPFDSETAQWGEGRRFPHRFRGEDLVGLFGGGDAQANVEGRTLAWPCAATVGRLLEPEKAEVWREVDARIQALMAQQGSWRLLLLLEEWEAARLAARLGGRATWIRAGGWRLEGALLTEWRALSRRGTSRGGPDPERAALATVANAALSGASAADAARETARLEIARLAPRYRLPALVLALSSTTVPLRRLAKGHTLAEVVWVDGQALAGPVGPNILARLAAKKVQRANVLGVDSEGTAVVPPGWQDFFPLLTDRAKRGLAHSGAATSLWEGRCVVAAGPLAAVADLQIVDPNRLIEVLALRGEGLDAVRCEELKDLPDAVGEALLGQAAWSGRREAVRGWGAVWSALQAGTLPSSNAIVSAMSLLPGTPPPLRDPTNAWLVKLPVGRAVDLAFVTADVDLAAIGWSEEVERDAGGHERRNPAVRFFAAADGSTFGRRGLHALREEDWRAALRSADPARELSDRVRGLAGLAAVSPFKPGGALRDDHPLFVGRTEEVEAILGHLHEQDALILGPRQSGKTSLLNHIFARCVARGDFFPIRVDLQGRHSLASIREELLPVAGQLGVAATLPWEPVSALRAIADAVLSTGRIAVVLINEIDWVLREARWVVEQLRGMADLGRARFVFTGYQTAFRATRDLFSPLFHFTSGRQGAYYLLGALAPDAARQIVGALERPPLGLRWATEADRIGATAFLLAETLCIAVLVQRACQEIVEHADRERKVVLALDDVRRWIANPPLRSLFLHLDVTELLPSVASVRANVLARVILQAVAIDRYRLLEPGAHEAGFVEEDPSVYGFHATGVASAIARTLALMPQFESERAAILGLLREVDLVRLLEGLCLTFFLAEGRRPGADVDPDMWYIFPDHIVPRELLRGARERRTVSDLFFSDLSQLNRSLQNG